MGVSSVGAIHTLNVKLLWQLLDLQSLLDN